MAQRQLICINIYINNIIQTGNNNIHIINTIIKRERKKSRSIIINNKRIY